MERPTVNLSTVLTIKPHPEYRFENATCEEKDQASNGWNTFSSVAWDCALNYMRNRRQEAGLGVVNMTIANTLVMV